jgi:4-alpha-glucanotransferase
MRVIQFGFGDPGAHVYLPHRFTKDCVAYTGTHDNDTSEGWWEKCGANEREAALIYFGGAPDGLHWAMVRAAEMSVAERCVIPLQDILGLDSNSRMNIPSHPEGNWTWRYSADALTDDLAWKLAAITEVSDRAPSERSEQRDGEVRESFSA